MQNENSESAISTTDTHIIKPNSASTADISNAINTATSNAFSKKIGRTMYTVQIFFSKTSKESFNDKLLRLIKNDIANGVSSM